MSNTVLPVPSSTTLADDDFSLVAFVARFNPRQPWQRSNLRTRRHKLDTRLRQIERMRERVLKAAERHQLRPSGGVIQVTHPTTGRVMRALAPFGLDAGLSGLIGSPTGPPPYPAGFLALRALHLDADIGLIAADQVHNATVATALEHLDIERGSAQRDIESIDQALSVGVRQ